jgi:hypothetical protein
VSALPADVAYSAANVPASDGITHTEAKRDEYNTVKTQT